MSVTVAARYARALYELAVEHQAGDKIGVELQQIVTTIQQIPALGEALASSIIPGEAKKNIVGEVFSEQISPLTFNFLQLIIDKKRISELPAIHRRYQEMLRASQGVIAGEVISAVPLDEAELSRLASKLQQATGKQVELQTRVEAELIGGLVVRIGDRVIDGSVRTQLATLRQVLTAGPAASR